MIDIILKMHSQVFLKFGKLMGQHKQTKEITDILKNLLLSQKWDMFLSISVKKLVLVVLGIGFKDLFQMFQNDGTF